MYNTKFPYNINAVLSCFVFVWLNYWLLEIHVKYLPMSSRVTSLVWRQYYDWSTTHHFSVFIMGEMSSQIKGVSLVRRRSKKTSRLCVTGLLKGNPPVAGDFPSQRASHAEIVSIWWRHHETFLVLRSELSVKTGLILWLQLLWLLTTSGN